MNIKTLLGAIGSTEESTFSEIVTGLGDDRPARGDSPAWSEFFRAVDKAERDGLIEVSRIQGKIDSAILTDAGVAAVRS